jgi:SAM-dependent methyltransferase
MTMKADPDAIQQASLWDEWAQYFPKLYPDRDPTAIVDFLCKLAPQGTALEWGPGTGRVTVPLAAAGVSIVAVEVSKALAEHLRTNAAPYDVTVVVGDMATYGGTQTFDLIFAARSTFFHVTDQERQIQCLANAATLLKPDGVLVLDCFVPYADARWASHEVKLASLDAKAVNLRATTIDRVAQLITYREIRLSEEGTRVLPVEQRYCTPAELDLMARIAGLTLRDRYADYENGPFTSDSHRHVSVYQLGPNAVRSGQSTEE